VKSVTGSIAAYKAVLLARLLVQAGARVLPVMTESARQFVGAATLAGITGQTVRETMWDAYAGEIHVALAAQAELVLVVPATADALARFASGRAEDLLTALVLCAKSPVLAAPAMHPRMWGHPAVKENVAALARQGRVALVGPTEGEVASGEEGIGRMAEPQAIFRAAEAVFTRQDLAGLHVVVTAGPTHEALDPVRYLGNRSSGTMGFRVAERAAARGAQVTLISGPVGRTTPEGVARIDVTTAEEMRKALEKALKGAHALVMAAAVADYRPKAASKSKLKRQEGTLSLDLVPNADLLAEIGAARTGTSPVLVGFALETEDGKALVGLARKKLAKKRVDLIVANAASVALGGENNRATLVSDTAARDLGLLSKEKVADEILDFVAARAAVRA
jgi:phosphopantothenoylcysteine decarboxylase / phosphopantothenate---cysteine ligase